MSERFIASKSIESGILRPAMLVCTNKDNSLYHNSIPLWGIALPKDVFLNFFEQEKGPWPTGKEYTQKLIEMYGPDLPTPQNTVFPNYANTVDNSNNITDSKNSTSDNIILSPEHFLSNDIKYAGIKWFGNDYSPEFQRNISLEVVRLDSIQASNMLFYSLKDLNALLAGREIIPSFYALGNAEAVFERMTLDMRVVKNYFSHVYRSKDSENIFEKNTDVSKLVTILRASFAEEDLFSNGRLVY